MERLIQHDLARGSSETILEFATKCLRHPNPNIRRETIQGIELWGRKHPEDILPLLATVPHDPNGSVRETVIHVLGQISSKEGCLEKVISALKCGDHRELVENALKEILEVHQRYERFSLHSYKAAKGYVEPEFKKELERIEVT